MWVEVRVYDGDEVRARRCASAGAALAEIDTFAVDSLFFAVDMTGVVLTRQQLATRAAAERGR
jgi:hypothetical protein